MPPLSILPNSYKVIPMGNNKKKSTKQYNMERDALTYSTFKDKIDG